MSFHFASCARPLARRACLTSVALAVAQSPLTAQTTTPPVRVTIQGTVRSADGAVIASARVRLAGTPFLALTNETGSYRLSPVPPGTYLLQVTRLGYTPSPPESLAVVDQDVTRDVSLVPASIPLSRVVITPGSYSVLDEQATSSQVLTRQQLLTAPQLAEDLFRSFNRLPGFSGSDFSAKLRIRNGLQDEQLVTLDGLELLEPFHLKDLDGALSILDAEAMGRVELVTGGFGAQWGNRTTGLMHLHSAQPSPGRARNSVGISFSNVRMRSEGTFAGGKGNWLASARRGYLDVLLGLIGEEDAPDPTYSDVLTRVQYQLGSRHLVSLHTLYAGDQLFFSEDNGETRVRSTYRNLYLWGSWRAQLRDGLSVTTLLSNSGLDWARSGRDAQRLQNTYYERTLIQDTRSLDARAVKQDWVWDATPRLSVFAGGEYRDEDADYRYARTTRDRGLLNGAVQILDQDSVRASLAPTGARTSAYLTARGKPISWLTVEGGVRRDRLSWTGQTTVVPRVNLAYTGFSRTTVRAAWGTYAQGHALQDLSIVDGDTLFVPAERAAQRIVGVERDLGNGWTVRTEAFERVLRSPRPRWFNTDGDINLLPEAAEDRVRIAPSSGSVRGIELLATLDRGGPFRLTSYYVLSKGRQVVGGVENPRPFDERHSAAVDLAWRSVGGWTWAAAWTFHSGWPHSPGVAVLDTLSNGNVIVSRAPQSPVFTERLPGYQRIDVRMTREFGLAGGRASVFAEVFNLFNTTNVRGYGYVPSVRNRQPFMFREREDFLPRLPSIGVRWAF